jgi:hypothetical protein
MLRFSTLAFLCFAATPALAQDQTAPAGTPAAPPPEAIAAIQSASATFNACIQTGVAALPATVTPEAGATSVTNGCASQRAAIEQAVRALIATLPEASRPMALEQMQTQIAAIPAMVAERIRQVRTPAATPAQ